MNTVRQIRWSMIENHVNQARQHEKIKSEWLIVLPSPQPGFRHIYQLPMIGDKDVYETTHANRKERVFDEIKRDYTEEQLKQQMMQIIGYVFNDKMSQFNFYQQGDMIWFLIHFFEYQSQDSSTNSSVEVYHDEKVVMIDFQCVEGFVHPSPSMIS